MVLASKPEAPTRATVKNWSLRDAAILWMCAVILAQSIFASVPRIDIAISQLFFDEHFYLKDSVAIEQFRRTLVKIISLPALMALAGVGLTFLRSRSLFVGASVWRSILAVYVFGPGIIANGLLKRFWGRARPDTIIEFGGHAGFTPPGQISDQCASNCSFVSGEASGATAFLLSVFLLTQRLPSKTHRSIARAIGFVVFLAVGMLRIGLGRHFASDVIFAVLITLGVGLLVGWTFDRRAKVPQN